MPVFIVPNAHGFICARNNFLTFEMDSLKGTSSSLMFHLSYCRRKHLSEGAVSLPTTNMRTDLRGSAGREKSVSADPQSSETTIVIWLIGCQSICGTYYAYELAVLNRPTRQVVDVKFRLSPKFSPSSDFALSTCFL